MKRLLKFAGKLVGGFVAVFFLFLLFLSFLDPNVKESEFAALWHQRMKTLYLSGVAALHEDHPSCNLVDWQGVATPLYAPLISRFATESEEAYADEQKKWNWLVPIEILINQQPAHYFSEMDGKHVASQMEKFALLIHPDETKTIRMPIAPNPEDFKNRPPAMEGRIVASSGPEEADYFSFITGSFSGWLQLVEVENGSVLCQSYFEVKSSESVPYEFGHRRRANPPGTSVKSDFQNNLFNELMKSVPKNITFSYYLPKH